MMIFKKTVLVVASLALVCGVVGCKKKDVSNPETGALGLAATASWDKADVNNLLSYVPADASAVYASTHNFDLNNPALKSLVEKALSSLDATVKKLDELIASADAETAKTIKATRDQLADTVSSARDLSTWGIEPNGRADSVGYIQGTNIVAHAQIVDRDKFKTKIEGLINGMSAADPSLKLDVKTVGEGEDAWVIYTIPGDSADTDVAAPGLAIHYGKTLVTFAAVNAKAADAAQLAAFLKPAATPIDKAAFGKIDDNAAAVGFADHAKLLSSLKDPAVSGLINRIADDPNAVPAECVDEAADLVALFPRSNYVERILDPKTITVDSSVVVSDKDELAKLKALAVASPDLLSGGALAGLKLNLNVDKAIDYLTEVSGKLEAKTFKCSAYESFKSTARELPAAIAAPEIRSLVAGVSGINVAINALDLKNQKVDAIIDVAGPKIGTTVPAVIEMLKAISPEIVSMFSLTKDQVSTFDLTPLVEMPLSVNATYTDSDLVVATAPNDVAKLAATKKVSNNNIVEILLDMGLINAIADEALPLTYTMQISYGVNDEGISNSVIMKF